jgi:ATP-dependent DNA helicase RecG
LQIRLQEIEALEIHGNSMKSALPINLEDLILGRSVESQRLEFKSTWDDYIKEAVVHTVCAFANDLLNLNGGYIIIGIEEENGQPVLPPRGFHDSQVDNIQRQIAGACRSGISPEYLPVLFVEVYQGKTIIVIMAPAGDNRPYQALKRQGLGRCYRIRSGAMSIEAQGDLLRQLMEAAAKIPFDDRRSLAGSISDISIIRVKRFLEDIRSHLAALDIPSEEILRKLRLVIRVNNHEVPRNVALMFFSEDPEQFFRGARIEVVQFGDDAGGDLIEEKEFRGPLPEQIRSCLNYLDGIGGNLLRKISGQAEVERTVAYPYEAMEEAIVNAVYHRSYETPPEPTKIYLYPDRMEVVSYPGPVPGIQMDHLRECKIPPVPARNRRIGEFLKDLRLAEGRGTGIPKIQRKMSENGSPLARFDFDPDRTYFRVTLPVHPRYQTIHAIREAAHLWSIGEKRQSVALLKRAVEKQPSSGALANQIIEYAIAQGDIDYALQVIETFERQEGKTEASLPFLTLARLFLDQNRIKEARRTLERMPISMTAYDTIEAAILKKRARDFEGAHRLFAKAYSLDPDNSKILQEFAQTKNSLAGKLFRSKDVSARKRLNQEAAELLRKAIQLTDDPKREGWCWLDLARTLDWLRSPRSEVEAAFLRACSLLPGESLIHSTYERWKNRNDRRQQ